MRLKPLNANPPKYILHTRTIQCGSQLIKIKHLARSKGRPSAP